MVLNKRSLTLYNIFQKNQVLVLSKLTKMVTANMDKMESKKKRKIQKLKVCNNGKKTNMYI